MSNGPLASSKINSEKRRAITHEKMIFFKIFENFILEGHKCSHHAKYHIPNLNSFLTVDVSNLQRLYRKYSKGGITLKKSEFLKILKSNL